MTGRNGRTIDAAKLRELLVRKLWSLTDLARQADVSYRTVKYGASNHPRVFTPAVCQAIANALDCHPDDFSTPVGPQTARAAS